MLIHQTPEQFAARLMQRMRMSIPEEAPILAAAAVNVIDSGLVTDAQMRSAFGLSVADWAKRKAEFTSVRAAMQTIKAAKK